MADDAYAADDAILLYLVRDGDTEAFGVLRQRHEQAASRLARCLVSAEQADPVVAETFDRVLKLTLSGAGPTDAFRPFLLTALRRVSYKKPRAKHLAIPAHPRRLSEPDEFRADPSAAGLQTSKIVRAFRSIPERWSAVLWHTEIEKTNPAELGQILGITRGEVAALRHRAWDGLRQAYLRIHMAGSARPECQAVALRLAAFVADEASARDTAMVTEHLSHCDDCHAVCTELADIDVALHTTIPKVYLGSAAASYLSAEHAAEAGTAAAGARAPDATTTEAAAVQPDAAGSARRASSVRSGRRQVAGQRRHSSRRWLWVAAAAVPVITVVVLLTLTFTGGGTPSTLSAAAPTPTRAAHSPAGLSHKATAGRGQNTTDATGSPTPQPGTSPAGPASPASAGSHPPITSPVAATELTATVDVSTGHRNANVVTWTVTDTGRAITGGLTVSVTLPPGTSMQARQVSGWTCQRTTAGAACQHSALSPGSQAQGAMSISISSPACGLPVDVDASGGNASVSAESREGIDCSNLRQ